jgi:hypothetical protein
MVNAGIKLYQMLDLLHFAAMRQLPDFDYWWFFEYDTDFSAGWEHFFKLFCDCHADLVGSTLYPRNMDPNWFHWPKFRAPAHVRSEMHTRGFFPVVRLSRKFAEVYQSEMRNTWRGTFEALYPTIAVSNGLLVEDIGGSRGKGCPGIGTTWIA